MREPDRPRVAGVLAPYAVDFRTELDRLGYSPYTAAEHLYLMAHLSRWLDEHNLCPPELSPKRIGEFLSDRRSRGQSRWVTPRGIACLVRYLREIGVVPEQLAPAPASPTERLMAAFVDYLRDERGLVPATIAANRHFAELFLSACSKDLTVEGCGLESLEPKQINEFILAESARRSMGSTKNLAMALRVLMRFLFLEGYTPVSLVDSVPRPIPWRDSGRSRALSPEQVRRLLASCDRRRATGRRDFAILTALSRLGLRRGEVASLSLDDVDWRAGEIVVCGKGGLRDRLPLPTDVGKALADYCRQGRPQNGHRALFLQAQAPYGPLSCAGVTLAVKAACQRAGIEPVGAHRLRHSAATSMRRAGAPLFEIGKVLRHSVAASSALYAKEDLSALASIARPWPGAQS